MKRVAICTCVMLFGVGLTFVVYNRMDTIATWESTRQSAPRSRAADPLSPWRPRSREPEVGMTGRLTQSVMAGQDPTTINGWHLEQEIRSNRRTGLFEKRAAEANIRRMENSGEIVHINDNPRFRIVDTQTVQEWSVHGFAGNRQMFQIEILGGEFLDQLRWVTGFKGATWD